MAARALQPLVQKGQLNSVMIQLLGMIPVEPKLAKHSHVHGALIQVSEKKLSNWKIGLKRYERGNGVKVFVVL